METFQEMKNSFVPAQTNSVTRDMAEMAPSMAAAGVQASGWLDILGKAAKGALGAVMG